MWSQSIEILNPYEAIVESVAKEREERSYKEEN